MDKIETFTTSNGIKHVKKPFQAFHYYMPIRCIVDIIDDAMPEDLYSAEYLAAFWAFNKADSETPEKKIHFYDVSTNLCILFENGAEEFDIADAFTIAQVMINECGRLAEDDVCAWHSPTVQSAVHKLGY